MGILERRKKGSTVRTQRDRESRPYKAPKKREQIGHALSISLAKAQGPGFCRHERSEYEHDSVLHDLAELYQRQQLVVATPPSTPSVGMAVSLCTWQHSTQDPPLGSMFSVVEHWSATTDDTNNTRRHLAQGRSYETRFQSESGLGAGDQSLAPWADQQQQQLRAAANSLIAARTGGIHTELLGFNRIAQSAYGAGSRFLLFYTGTQRTPQLLSNRASPKAPRRERQAAAAATHRGCRNRRDCRNRAEKRSSSNLRAFRPRLRPVKRDRDSPEDVHIVHRQRPTAPEMTASSTGWRRRGYQRRAGSLVEGPRCASTHLRPILEEGGMNSNRAEGEMVAGGLLSMGAEEDDRQVIGEAS
ncbi:hypothetical protein BJ912DRAFT_1047861 [Pholiota molesta]|nr:hypothetical protein BJ912DRAFT_1047861 [Pholiota molesta]